MFKIKICGLTTLEDALAAVDAGADMLGYNFYPPSPRYIAPNVCERIQSGLRQRGVSVTAVGVFVDADPGSITSILDSCGLDLAQLSGDESPQVLRRLGSRSFKALRPATRSALASALQAFPAREAPPAWLIDAFRPGQYGGTGHVADWSLARSVASQAPVLLAGGLCAENVADALRQVHPWGVDVASGVESSPGRKDSQKMAAFVTAVRNFVQEKISC